MCHDIIMPQMIGGNSQVVFHALPVLEENGVVIKRYYCEHGCVFLIGTRSSCGGAQRITVPEYIIWTGGDFLSFLFFLNVFIRLNTLQCLFIPLNQDVLWIFLVFNVKLKLSFYVPAEACTWTSPILPSVPSMGSPSTAQGRCTPLTSHLRMSPWWGRRPPAR